MPYKPFKAEKLYFTIGEVAEIFGESTSLIRFWADKFPQYIKPERNKKGNRLFSQQDLQNFKTIHYLVKQRGMTLDGAAKRMKENKDGLNKNVEIIDKLDEIKIMLQQVYESL
ncbi:MAG: MerR family transcriptional regulator [Bacteroidales bacterium]|nr:MerR family transcriptional regulator [Bacteroidales bacterium]